MSTLNDFTFWGSHDHHMIPYLRFVWLFSTRILKQIQYMYWIHCWKIYNLFVQALEKGNPYWCKDYGNTSLAQINIQTYQLIFLFSSSKKLLMTFIWYSKLAFKSVKYLTVEILNEEINQICYNVLMIRLFNLVFQIIENCKDIQWHFIGHLQRKKIKKLIGRFVY
jgi:hypothetical protein